MAANDHQRPAYEWSDVIVTQTELATFLQLSPGRIRQLTHERIIPPEARVARGRYNLQIAVLGVLRHKEQKVAEAGKGLWTAV